ncbi:hypothetical protein CF319_g9000 [Tilletia indica]|nr:hypothetical protein CF319_g9000 [Tilletia indica]
MSTISPPAPAKRPAASMSPIKHRRDAQPFSLGATSTDADNALQLFRTRASSIAPSSRNQATLSGESGGGSYKPTFPNGPGNEEPFLMDTGPADADNTLQLLRTRNASVAPSSRD